MNVDIDLKLRLLGGLPINVCKKAGRIKPLTVGEIIDYGYTNYLMKLHFFTLELNDFLGEEASDSGITLFDIMVLYGNDDIKIELINSLKLFFHEEFVSINSIKELIVIGEGDNARIIDRDNFDTVREVIKWQNCINKLTEDDSKDTDGDSDAVRRIKERLRQSKEALKKAKQEGDSENEEIDLYDIISSVSSKSNSLNKKNILDLTLFQLYDEFKRLELIEQYDIGIKSMLAGAKDVKLKHWSTKVE
jgi:hypothetical protein